MFTTIKSAEDLLHNHLIHLLHQKELLCFITKQAVYTSLTFRDALSCINNFSKVNKKFRDIFKNDPKIITTIIDFLSYRFEMPYYPNLQSQGISPNLIHIWSEQKKPLKAFTHKIKAAIGFGPATPLSYSVEQDRQSCANIQALLADPASQQFLIPTERGIEPLTIALYNAIAQLKCQTLALLLKNGAKANDQSGLPLKKVMDTIAPTPIQQTMRDILIHHGAKLSNILPHEMTLARKRVLPTIENPLPDQKRKLPKN